MVYRVFVEKKPGLAPEAAGMLADCRSFLGLTNLEALACGTPVITFDRGGSPECVDETCGAVVPCDDMPALVNAIDRVTRGGGVSPEACRAYASRFNAEDAFGEYVKLYGIAYESTARETI